MSAEADRQFGNAQDTFRCLHDRIEAGTANCFEKLQYDEALRTIRSKTIGGKLRNFFSHGGIKGRSFRFELMLRSMAGTVVLGLIWFLATMMEGAFRALSHIAVML